MIKIENTIIEEIRLQRNCCVLFSSKKVIATIDNFLVNLSAQSAHTVIDSIKEDLWRKN